MPAYEAPSLFFNAHIETICPALFRKIQLSPYQRERITTPDDDFLDLDWLKQGSNKLVIISHGLEGNSQRAYIQGMAKHFFSNGYDVLAWNYRGCSGEMNRQQRFYHSGATDDLKWVIDNASANYDSIYLVGFSLGGNLSLKYLGEGNVNSLVKKAVVFSVPLELHTSCLEILKSSNWMYHHRFLRSLKAKVIAKANQRTDLDISQLDQIKTLIQFDDHFTAPIHGFANAIDYYKKCSSLYFLSEIRIPTLIVNAKNDPFLSNDCYPELPAGSSVKMETPSHGGHVGFAQFGQNGLYWSELRAFDFIDHD
ncbi:MAG: alpha/beta fold hydrolase [Cyclobacteriaceae bacterium]|nr:alpha/beta fold hydrolase [Cyclobacteriaceae bacterium]